VNVNSPDGFGRSVLFIDRRGKISSVPEAHIPVPFVLENFRHDLWRVRALFAPYRYDLSFIQAMADELTRGFHAVPRALPYPDGVIDAGERAIAGEQIAVARALPDGVALSFDPQQPSTPHWSDAVVFPSFAVAVDFLSVVLRNTDNASALGAALDGPAGEMYAGMAVGGQTSADVAALPPSAGALLQRAAWPLTRRYLGLLPRDPSRRRLRIAWLERRVPGVAAAASDGSLAPTRAASPPPPPPPPAGPMSVLPDPPAELTPQAQTLIEAAKNGTPFCEECARRAAELAGA
jgi:hypothetical protein